MFIGLQSTETLRCFLHGGGGQRRAIEGERQYLTFRQTLRTVPMTFSMILVQASERRIAWLATFQPRDRHRNTSLNPGAVRRIDQSNAQATR